MNNILADGYAAIERGEIAWIDVRDEDVHESLLNPSVREITEMCRRYGFPIDETLKIIRDADPSVYGFVFDAVSYRDSFMRNSTVHLYYESPDSDPICEAPETFEWVRFDPTAKGKLCKDCVKVTGRNLT